ncbi:MAG: excinuclease ABC subunit UvrB [Chitinispirillales bacterium]|jgi:excinuclease ABC subunit B|nr:excinuclease ABC subunit UvrB [Chitinispirillales bacterium]
MPFNLVSDYSPAGDQPKAIAELTEGIKNGEKFHTLLGVTGSGKTFTIANVIKNLNMPVLIISHNKTLAAQLFEEFKAFFPENAVEYFVSFYDYYQPEAYIPSTDTYIEKTADINDEIDRLRLKATASLLSRKDTIVVASVSCIYNIGSPQNYSKNCLTLSVNMTILQRNLLEQFVNMQYVRNDFVFERGNFRVRGDTIDIYPAYEEQGLRLSFFGDELERISVIDPLTGNTKYALDEIILFPAKYYSSTNVSIPDAVKEIKIEMEGQIKKFESENKLIEAQRLYERTAHDMEMLLEVGYINGIENYSRILDGRKTGERPYSLLDFFEAPFLTIIDESHITVPQVSGMYNGDRARKQTLVNHGFRIPSALDNRPLKFDEFEKLLNNVIFLSATPANYELEKTGGVIVEQVIRPTGLVDPEIEVLPAKTQVDDLIFQLRKIVAKGERALVTTLTKRQSEDLSQHLQNLDFRVRYLHSEIDTLNRPIILNDLRKGEFDILIGINLLREGLDLPEVSLVAILDADREGFLRSTKSLIQIAGRAARNINGRIIFYADTITDSIKKTLEETDRRRKIQLEYNEANNIIPRSTTRTIGETFYNYNENYVENSESLMAAENREVYGEKSEDLEFVIEKLTEQMNIAAKKLDFESAAKFRDKIIRLRGK